MRRAVILALVLAILAPAAYGQVTRRTPTTLRILNQRVPEIELIEQPLDQVLEWLGELNNISIIVRWQMLEDMGIDRDKPISIKARNLRLSQVLWLVMNEAGGSDVKLAYRATGPLLVLSTEEDLSKEMVTKVYDVADLLIRIPNASRDAAFDVTQGMGEGGQQGGGGGQGMFGEGNEEQDDDYEDDERNGNNVQLDTLIELIQQTVEPDSWRENGGRGTIIPFRRLLVVHNTILVHQRLGGYLTENEISGP